MKRIAAALGIVFFALFYLSYEVIIYINRPPFTGTFGYGDAPYLATWKDNLNGKLDSDRVYWIDPPTNLIIVIEAPGDEFVFPRRGDNGELLIRWTSPRREIYFVWPKDRLLIIDRSGFRSHNLSTGKAASLVELDPNQRQSAVLELTNVAASQVAESLLPIDAEVK